VQDHYIEKGYEVVVVDNLSTGKMDNLNPKAKFYQVDIRDWDSLEKVFIEEKPDIVNHHAAQISVVSSTENPQEDMEINIKGLINVLQLSVKYNVKKFLFSSSGGTVYGDPIYLPCDELHPIDPQSPYGISKYSGELYIKYFHKNYGLDYVIMRYGNVYGPRQDPFGEAGVVAIFTVNMLQGKDCYIFGDGYQERDFVYIDDVARVNIMLTELNLQKDRVFNIGTGYGTNVITIFNLLKSYTNYEKPPIYKSPRKGEIYKIYLNVDRIKKYGWTPQVSLEEGLKRTVESFKSKI